MSQARISSRAAEAAARLARRLGIGSVDPVILHESQRINIRLCPLDIVARGMVFSDAEVANKLACDLDVARHLVKKAAPVIGPSADLPAGPHVQEDFVFTLWEFVEHVAADDDNNEHIARAAEALRGVHRALVGFPGELPDFWPKIDRCRDLLENDLALPALRAADRTFLLTAFNRLRASAAGLPVDVTPIHGDAHLGNVFMTPEGARWNDFDDVCLGPREWDIGWVPEAHLAAFEPLNRDLLSALHYLRSLCASVWCWGKWEMPEKREAAEYHLEYLKASYPFGNKSS